MYTYIYIYTYRLGPALATLQGAVPPERRGAAQGVFSALTALGNVLPMALGFLGPGGLVTGLQVSVSACYVLSAGCFLVAAAARSEACICVCVYPGMSACMHNLACMLVCARSCLQLVR